MGRKNKDCQITRSRWIRPGVALLGITAFLPSLAGADDQRAALFPVAISAISSGVLIRGEEQYRAEQKRLESVAEQHRQSLAYWQKEMEREMLSGREAPLAWADQPYVIHTKPMDGNNMYRPRSEDLPIKYNPIPQDRVQRAHVALGDADPFDPKEWTVRVALNDGKHGPDSKLTLKGTPRKISEWLNQLRKQGHEFYSIGRVLETRSAIEDADLKTFRSAKYNLLRLNAELHKDSLDKILKLKAEGKSARLGQRGVLGGLAVAAPVLYMLSDGSSASAQSISNRSIRKAAEQDAFGSELRNPPTEALSAAAK